MIINAQTPEVNKYRVMDCAGQLIPLVQSYDTDTKEITLMVRAVRAEGDDKPQFGTAIVPVEEIATEENKGTAKFAPLTLTFIMPGTFATCDGEIIAPGTGIHPAFQMVQAAEQAAAEVAAEVEQVGEVEIVEEKAEKSA